MSRIITYSDKYQKDLKINVVNLCNSKMIKKMPENNSDPGKRFIEQGRELYNISMQEELELQKLKDRSKNKGLKALIEKEIDASRDLRTFIQKGFRELNVSPFGSRDTSCKTILMEANSRINKSTDDKKRDVIIMSAIQRINYSKIEGLRSLSSYGEQIGEQIISSFAKTSLETEKEIDGLLSSLAIKEINKNAEKA